MDTDIGRHQPLKLVKFCRGTTAAVSSIGNENKVLVLKRIFLEKIGREAYSIDKRRAASELCAGVYSSQELVPFRCPLANDLGLVAVLHQGNRVTRSQRLDQRTGHPPGLIERLDAAHLAAGIHNDEHIGRKAADTFGLMEHVILGYHEVSSINIPKKLPVLVKRQNVELDLLG